jgi:hypothetical protein
MEAYYNLITEQVDINSTSNIFITDQIDVNSNSNIQITDQVDIISNSNIIKTEQIDITSDSNICTIDQVDVNSDTNIQITDSIPIKSDAKISNPHTFIFTYAPVNTTTDTADDLVVNFNVIEPKLKHFCNHYLSSGQYRLVTCPRCLGTGYYYDIKFDDVGKLIQLQLSEKLTQQLEKIVITKENEFHPEVAINIQKWLGNVSISEVKAAIKFELLKSLLILQETQRDTPNLFGQVQIGRIDNISVYDDPADPVRLYYVVQVTTVAGINQELNGTVLLQ